jgi:hypothetical protein
MPDYVGTENENVGSRVLHDNSSGSAEGRA